MMLSYLSAMNDLSSSSCSQSAFCVLYIHTYILSLVHMLHSLHSRRSLVRSPEGAWYTYIYKHAYKRTYYINLYLYINTFVLITSIPKLLSGSISGHSPSYSSRRTPWWQCPPTLRLLLYFPVTAWRHCIVSRVTLNSFN